MVSDARAAAWQSAATADALEGQAFTLTHAVLALARERRQLQRYAERLTSGVRIDARPDV